ncbi:glycosyltransferase family 4 protein [Prevotella sp. OH937_COT-195]|uniref:glycosyltransferase family 4 protein n=1 Tax=Prevotella sp. OH937_COT-195 TaxID=2491051 RepID=UPI000F654FC6|nr:glycosyltransferase family 4 protein [Prevotella sp. OH937_COT-195]RRD02515.1 glycosyltransferase [Prevotella sp. OH937_COT-195]
MKIYYYHTQDAEHIINEWKRGRYPSHLLYGATFFEENGIDVVMHKHRQENNRLRRMLRVAWQVMRRKERYDVLYGSSHRGLELLIMLRALGIYSHPICIWHHQPVKKARGWLRECVSRIYYRGIDRMLMFSDTIAEMSGRAAKCRPERIRVVHWGADLDYYDRFMREHRETRRDFVSSGMERRDMPTLISAFNNTGLPLRIFSIKSYLGNDYEKIIGNMECRENIEVTFNNRLMIDELTAEVNRAACVTICCLPTNYTVGLTTVVEALALGIPIICSRNPQLPMNIEAEGCGLLIDYGDVAGWERAIRFVAEHPEEAREMGKRGRELAERLYNIRQCTSETASVIKELLKR